MAPPRRWTSELCELVRRRRLAGETTEAIGAELGVGWKAIAKAVPLTQAEFNDARSAIAEKRRAEELRRRVRQAYHEMRPEFIAWARTI